jgi:cytochrome P450
MTNDRLAIDLFSSKGSYRVLLNPDEKTMIGQDDPAHQDQRKLISNRFTSKRWSAWGSVSTCVEAKFRERVSWMQ